MVELGTVTLGCHYEDGVLTSVTVGRADQTIGISSEILSHPVFLRTDEDGNLHIADQVVYRPVGFAEDGRLVVCERVDRAR